VLLFGELGGHLIVDEGVGPDQKPAGHKQKHSEQYAYGAWKHSLRLLAE
jgi:hypothetical protein